MEKRILLVSPNIKHNGINPGLGLLNAYLISKGYRTRLLDYGIIKEYDLEKEVSSFSPSFVLMSVNQFNYKDAIFLAGKIKKAGTVFVAGGPFLTLDYLGFDKLNGSFDFGITGENENTVLALLDGIIGKKDVSGIKGVVYKWSNKIHYTGKPGLQYDLDSFGMPVYPEEIYTKLKKIPFSYIMITSRGCPYKCVFCPNPLLLGNRWRGRSAENVIEEISKIKQKGITSFNIMDDNFTYDVERAKKILMGIKILGLKMDYILGNGIRADTVDDEIARLFKETGCRRVPVGIENADPKTFRFVKKGTSLDKIENAIYLLKKYKLNTEAFMIIGLIKSDNGSLRRSLGFIKKMNILARWYIAMPIKGTEFYEWVRKEGKIFDKGDNEGTWSAKPPVWFETKQLNREEMLHYFYYLNSETGNYYFLMEGKNHIKRFFSAAKNIMRHNPRKIPGFLIWCLLALRFGNNLVFNTIKR